MMSRNCKMFHDIMIIENYSFTDPREVYETKTNKKIGMIYFSEKPLIINNQIIRHFRFEPETNVVVICKIYSNIARYIYKLENDFIDMKKENKAKEVNKAK